MKKFLLLFSVFLATYASYSQVKVPQSSPKGMVEQVVGLTDVTIDYSRPSMKGRRIFGDLVPFGKLWRTGANGNTKISFTDDVTIDGKILKKGTYALFTIPKAESWEIIFYNDVNNWGTPETLEDSKIALKTSVKSELLNKKVETFTIAISNLDNNFAHLELSWENTVVAVKFEVPTQKTAIESIDKALAGPAASDYFSAGQYYFQSNGDLKKALEYVNKALEMSTEKPFWYSRQKSLIQAKLGDKKGAIESAKISLAAATAAKNNDYVKMNNDSISEWSKK